MKNAIFLLVTLTIAGLLAAPVAYSGDYLPLKLQSTADFNVDSTADWSTDSGTIGIGPTMQYDHLDGYFVLGEPPATTGLGNADSAILKLYSVGPVARYVIDSVVCTTVPCTLGVTVHENVGDTLLKRTIELYWWISDSLSDSSFTVSYPVWWDVVLK